MYRMGRRAQTAGASFENDGISATDDSALVGRIGHPVAIVEEGPTNLKITTPDGLKMAEDMLG